MKKYLAVIFLFWFAAQAMAETSTIALEKVHTSSRDIESIKRGAKFFAANCMACHTLIYLRYDTLAQQAGVTYEKMPLNVKNWPLNVTPPDLSLAASAYGVDWLYTYLHSFYTDTTRPFGVNNLLRPNTAMPGMLVPYQGQQVLVKDFDSKQKVFNHQLQWYDVLQLQSPGSMTPQQFDATITDVVNFLAYAAEPYKNAQHTLGYWVIGFLLVLFVLTYLLKQAYWRGKK